MHSLEDHGTIVGADFDAPAFAVKVLAGNHCCAGAEEGVIDDTGFKVLHDTLAMLRHLFCWMSVSIPKV